MKFQRSDRVAGALLKLVSQLLNEEVNDPRIGIVTLTGAEVSRDLKHARIYVSPLGEKGKRDEILSGLKSATGFIRTRVARELRMRFAPEIEFVYDETPDQARRIENLLKQVKEHPES
jgi:ribosome-binding factor A